jgi:Dolichyl-phosphate-mannose-protein mannosyltransferase
VRDWRRVPGWALLVALVGVSTLVRFWAGNRIRGLWIMPDEAIYASVAESLYTSGELAVLGQPAYYSFVYPALIGLPLVVGDLEAGYVAVKLVQALAMSLAAVPVYLWGRTFMSRGWALVAAALTLAGPALVFTGLLMTEVAFYPVLVVAAWAMARALERPTLGRQAVVVAAVAAAAATCSPRLRSRRCSIATPASSGASRPRWVG